MSTERVFPVCIYLNKHYHQKHDRDVGQVGEKLVKPTSLSYCMDTFS